MSSDNLKVVVLGTGTSQGIPVIGCRCEVCLSSNPKDKRLRTSALMSMNNENIVIDVGPDFRMQMLAAQVDHLDGIVLTHEHNDHIIGLDDIRPFNFIRRKPITIFATPHVQQELMKRFRYVFEENPYPGAPRVALSNIHPEQTFEIGSFTLNPILVSHGIMPVLGFRIGDFTYITDAKTIDPFQLDKAKKSKVLILNALHHKPHHSHFNLQEALDIIDYLKPQKTYLTHISHHMGLHDEVNTSLPAGVELAYDGLEISI